MRLVVLFFFILLGACSKQTTDPNTQVDTMTTLLPYGSWPSPISAASLVEGSRGFSSLSFDGDYLYWVESRPEEAGRNTIMRWTAGGEPEEILAAPWNARSRVQEYGGRSVLVVDGTIWFSNFQDQRLYRMAPGSDPQAITPESDIRFAGCVYDSSRNRLICVREDHRPLGEPVNTLVALPLEGVSEGEVLFAQGDFVSAASLSADGNRIAFVSWRHPNMPWDNTTLWSASFDVKGGLAGLTEHNPDSGESVVNPQWSKEGLLYVSSDRDNWWSLYQVSGRRFTRVESGLADVEIGGPQWQVGQSYYHLLDGGKILAQVMDGGIEYAAVVDPVKGASQPLALSSAAIIDILPVGNRLFVINASTEAPPALLEIDAGGNTLSVIRTATDSKIDADWIPQYQLVSFASGPDATAHGIYLPPRNPGAQAPQGDAPPLIVSVHGGPTGVSTPSFKLSHLFWTSRGFAILDLNYRGSTGFGRDYRRSLYGQWGIADVQDAAAGAVWLAEQGLADPERLIIRGGSAGGYTTLAAHAFHTVFAAGASYYGISDLVALASDTHKFESRYLDQVIGPYPERADLYRQRSPINHLEGFSAPLLVLQGLDDQVVPPNQSEKIFDALKSRGIATAYLAFEGEGHGFRKAESQIRSLEAELYFYARVLGFDTADDLPGIEIEGFD